MRHPVGPLPSSIYWRRRAVVLCLLALVIALIVWAVTSGGSGKKKNGAGGGHQGGHHPAQSLSPSPGPSTGNPIDGGPGGGSGGGGSGGNEGSGSGGQGNPGASGGSSGGQGSAGGAGSASGGTVSGGGSSTGGTVPAGSTLPDCTAATVSISLKATHPSYDPDQDPKFELTLTNSGSGTCKVDLGRKTTVITVTNASHDHIWSSDDCPGSTAPFLVQVPSDSKTVRTYTWNRDRSKPDCATVKGARTASNGTYVVEVSIPGLGSAPATFKLKS